MAQGQVTATYRIEFECRADRSGGACMGTVRAEFDVYEDGDTRAPKAFCTQCGASYQIRADVRIVRTLGSIPVQTDPSMAPGSWELRGYSRRNNEPSTE